MGCGASAKRPAAVAPIEQPVRKPADTTQASGPENDSVVSDTLPESAPPAALSPEGGEQDWAQATMHIEEEPPTAFESGAKDIVSVSDFKTGQPMDAWSLETLSQPEYLQMARSIASQRTKLWEQLLHKHAAGSGIFACLQKPHGSFQIDDWVGDQASISYAPGMDLFFAVVPPAPLCCIPCGSFGCPFGVQPAVVDLFLTVNGQPQQQQHLCQDGRPASRGGEEAAQKLGGAGAGAFASLILDSCGPETWGLLVPLVCTSIQEATGDVPEAPHWRYGLSCCLAASALLDSLGAGSHTLHFEAHFRGPAGKDVCFVPKDGGKPYSGQLLSHDGSSDLVAQLPSSGFHSATAVASATFTINLPAEAAGTLAASLCMEVELDKASEP